MAVATTSDETRVLRYRAEAENAGAIHKVPPTLILAVAHMESGGDPDAFRVEPALADASFGLMQVLLGTARGLGFTGPPKALFEPAVSIELGTRDLVGGIKDYGTAYLALIDYNGGPRAVWYYTHGWRRGPAVHYANVVYNFLRPSYEALLLRLDAAGRPAAGTS